MDTGPGPGNAARLGEDVRIVGSRMPLRARLARLWLYRELLAGMVRRELKVRYKNSYLGFLWSLLNPLMYLVVFYVAFSVILKAGIPNFPIFLLSGLLVWNLFSAGLGGSTGSVVANGSLVNKVYFPREVLPLAAVGSAVVHFALQLGVFAVVLLAIRWDVAWSWLPLTVPATLVLIMLTTGLGMLLAATNVYLRDTQHLVDLGLLGWFWVTPIVYPFGYIASLSKEWQKLVFMANPITPIVLVFQRAIYNTISFREGASVPAAGSSNGVNVVEIVPDWSKAEYLLYVGYAGVIAILMIVVGYWAFGRLEGNFAEEL